MSFSLIILAGGNSHRFRSNIGKPYQKIAGKSLIEINIDKARKIKAIKKIVVVYNKKDSKRIKSLKLRNIQLILGGKNRQQSAFNALKYLIKNRGVTKVLQPAGNNAESTDSGGLTAFGTDGFTVGNDAGYNGSTNNMVAHCWKANGGTTATNTDGSITSTVQANTKAGFSIVEFTGINSATTATVGHGLGKAPTFIIHKSLNTTAWHLVRGVPGMPVSYVRDLNPNGSPTDVSGNGGALVAPTSSVFNINNTTGIGGGGYTYVAYCWAPIEGYSKFGTYTGNGESDGPFIYTGFRPQIVLFMGYAYGIENFIDIVNGKTQDIVKAPNYDRYHDNEIIEWWRKMATKRFDNLNKDGRLRNDLEVWTKDSEIDIIR